MRLVPASLYGRMLLISATATLLALGIAGVVIAHLLSGLVVAGLDRRLDAEVALLASTVDTEGRIDRVRLAQRVGALEAGPGWRWRIAGPGGSIGSSDFPRLAEGPPPGGPHPPGPGPGPGPERDGLQPLDGASDNGAPVHARRLVLPGPRGTTTIIAAAPRAVMERPIIAALWPLLAALTALAVLLTAALLLQLRIGLRPLRRLRDEVAGIRRGDRHRVAEDQPAELQPLAVELNALTADNEAALGIARMSAANLAHALKTPVATLTIEIAEQPQLAPLVTRIDRTIRHHLARARAGAINRRVRTPLRPLVDDVAAAVLRLHALRGLELDIDVAPGLAVAVDPEDLTELLGNLLDNAAKHASRMVAVGAHATERGVSLTITDDGPGIPASDLPRAARPGVRLDESGDGHGFGLAIVRELAALYGGTLAFAETPGGGLTVSLTLPAG